MANKCCQGRLVSVLEGGYRIQGGIVSAFGRSVAGHVRALVDGCHSRQARERQREEERDPLRVCAALLYAPSDVTLRCVVLRCVTLRSVFALVALAPWNVFAVSQDALQ